MGSPWISAEKGYWTSWPTGLIQQGASYVLQCPSTNGTSPSINRKVVSLMETSLMEKRRKGMCVSLISLFPLYLPTYSGASQDKCLPGQKTSKTNGFGNKVDDSQDKCSYGRASQDECFPFFVPSSCLLIFKCFSMMFKKLKFFD